MQRKSLQLQRVQSGRNSRLRKSSNKLITVFGVDAKLITEPAKLLNSTLETLAAIKAEMGKLASQLPEYETVMDLYGVGRVFGAQLIAEIGDVRRLK